MAKAKPTALKAAAGNPGNRPLSNREPRPHGDLDRPPVELAQDEVRYWRHAIDHAPATLLKYSDRETLVIWCRAAALHQAAREELDDEGLTVIGGSGGIKVNPLIGVINQAAATMLKAGSELGFSPVARTRISLEAPTDDNPYDALDARKRA